MEKLIQLKGIAKINDKYYEIHCHVFNEPFQSSQLEYLYSKTFYIDEYNREIVIEAWPVQLNIEQAQQSLNTVLMNPAKYIQQ